MACNKTKKPWTDEDNADLRAAWGRKTAHEIAAPIGRTVAAVRQQAQRLGLRRAWPRYRPVTRLPQRPMPLPRSDHPA
jgi:hypothetical protein